jgi:hypothetical protein
MSAFRGVKIPALCMVVEDGIPPPKRVRREEGFAESAP